MIAFVVSIILLVIIFFIVLSRKNESKPIDLKQESKIADKLIRDEFPTMPTMADKNELVQIHNVESFGNKSNYETKSPNKATEDNIQIPITVTTQEPFKENKTETIYIHLNSKVKNTSYSDEVIDKQKIMSQFYNQFNPDGYSTISKDSSYAIKVKGLDKSTFDQLANVFDIDNAIYRESNTHEINISMKIKIAEILKDANFQIEELDILVSEYDKFVKLLRNSIKKNPELDNEELIDTIIDSFDTTFPYSEIDLLDFFAFYAQKQSSILSKKHRQQNYPISVVNILLKNHRNISAGILENDINKDDIVLLDKFGLIKRYELAINTNTLLSGMKISELKTIGAALNIDLPKLKDAIVETLLKSSDINTYIKSNYTIGRRALLIDEIFSLDELIDLKIEDCLNYGDGLSWYRELMLSLFKTYMDGKRVLEQYIETRSLGIPAYISGFTDCLTCKNCANKNGKKINNINNIPPLHIDCRCEITSRLI